MQDALCRGFFLVHTDLLVRTVPLPLAAAAGHSHIGDAGNYQLVRRQLLVFLDLVQDVLLPEQQHTDFMGSQFGAVPGCVLYDLFFFLGEFIKEDGGIGSILHCVLISRRCPTAGVAHGVFVSRLSAGLSGCRRVPPVFCLPAADRIIFKMEIIRQLPEIHFSVFLHPGNVLRAGGIALIASPCHLVFLQ